MARRLHPEICLEVGGALAKAGYAILPLEPTPEMELAGSMAALELLKDENSDPYRLAAIVYKAMVNLLVE